MAEQYKTYTQIPLGSSRLDTFDVSSLSCLVCRAVLFVKFGAAKMHGLDTSNVSSHVVSKRDELSGIWPILLSLSVFAALPAIRGERIVTNRLPSHRIPKVISNRDYRRRQVIITK